MILAAFPWEDFIKAALDRPGTMGPGPSARYLRVHTGEGPPGADGRPLFTDSYVDLDLASDPGEGLDADVRVWLPDHPEASVGVRGLGAVPTEQPVA